jgi:hypothetical protein
LNKSLDGRGVDDAEALPGADALLLRGGVLVGGILAYALLEADDCYWLMHFH